MNSGELRKEETMLFELNKIHSESVHLIVTSPPYLGICNMWGVPTKFFCEWVGAEINSQYVDLDLTYRYIEAWRAQCVLDFGEAS